MPEAKILIVDIETSPSLAWVYRKYQADALRIEKDWFLMSFSWKWLGETEVRHRQLPDYRRYNKHREDDRDLVRDLWKLYDKVDIVIGHNIDRFDTRKSNARFVFHGLNPPSSFKSVDTLKIARRNFGFTSNSLDDLGDYLGVGRKLAHNGAALWFGCLSNDPKSWKLMRRYNDQDVRLTERVYQKLRAWSPSHPDLTLFSRKEGCPTCLSPNIRRGGFQFVRRGKKQRWC